MPIHKQFNQDDANYAALKQGCNQLDILEESNRLVIKKLQAGDFASLPAVVEQRNLFENQLIKFNEILLKLLPYPGDRRTNEINKAVQDIAGEIRDKALRVSESYLMLIGIVEDGQKSLLQLLRSTRLSSKALQSYVSNSFARAENHLTLTNKGKEGK